MYADEAGSKSYTLTCSGDGGTIDASVLVDVLAPSTPPMQPGKAKLETHPAFAPSWKYKVFEFPEADDAATCTLAENNTATLGRIYFAQTHIMEPSWEFFHLSSDRPALIGVIVTGTGDAPDVKVSGFHDGDPVGEFCLSGPDTLPESVDQTRHQRDDRYPMTLPKSWIQPGLSLTITAGQDEHSFSAEELGIVETPDMNMAIFDLVVMDYLDDANRRLGDFDTFLENLAESVPGAQVRVGRFPKDIVFPSLAVHTGQREPSILTTKFDRKGLPDDGNINAAVLLALNNIQRALGLYPTVIAFGHTGELFPGGWGGDSAFVSGDYDDVTIHEFGHAAGNLPHWGWTFGVTNPDPWTYRYPYRVYPNEDSSGRGANWNYKQSKQAFVSPLCENPNAGRDFGVERQDAMQRRVFCPYYINGQPGPWDGFSDFSAFGMYRYLIGATEV